MTAIGVVYASETGTARNLAHRIATWLRAGGLCLKSGEEREMDWQGGTLLWDKTPLLIIVCSTTGDGEAPRGMRHVWQRLLEKGCERLEGVSYALYGLGDARYGAKFNAAARRLDARLLQLGCHRLVERVLADACAPNGGPVAPLFEFYTQLASALGIRNSPEVPMNADELEPVPKVTLCPDEAGETPAVRREGWDEAVVVSNQRLTSTSWHQEVRAIRFKGAFKYASGHVAKVSHQNCQIMIDRALAIARRTEPSLQLNTLLEIGDSRLRFDRWFGERLDLTKPPDQLSLGRLAFFAESDEQASKLRQLAKPEGLALFDEYAVQERRSLVDILEDFETCRPPLDRFLAEFPYIEPRAFSIASPPTTNDGPIDQEVDSDTLELCVAVVDINTTYGRKLKGACSSWLATLLPGSRTYLSISKGTFFQQPIKPPFVLIGPGTGVAPMRAIGSRLYPSVPYTLYFGCRHPEHDHLYASETWRPPERTVLAFSKHPDPTQRAYVTHRLKERATDIARVLLSADSGAVLVAGNIRMATDVRNLFLTIIQDHLHCAPKRAQLVLTKLEKAGRFVVEAYG